ncbi:AAA family ATPase [Nitrogeniibacter aestuarii]|uniref:AAA family ATPase n=1 Tax=Nitrogeniibacter aestuarii TaxID=2815343 RepID=UPI001D0FB55D|nr:ATP-binding protein [Nitrogeniibacter aestuarii]
MDNLNYSESDFGERLNKVLSASKPINSIEFLKGRDRELETIKRALYADGRHVFIFGDRGVGKSSLGQTAAIAYQSSDAEPIFVSGSPDDSFSSIVANIVARAISKPRTKSVKNSKKISLSFRGLSIGEGEDVSPIDIESNIQTIGDAVELLRQAGKEHSAKPIIVIDEFDTISSLDERNKFSYLLKQLGDQAVNIKFIFTGIARSLDELLGVHQSAYRQLETVELPRLGWDARREIVTSTAAAFNITVDNDVNWRICMVSDGYPYYIHLVLEKILWAAYILEPDISEIGWDLFHEGLHEAILATSAELKRPYEKAVLHREESYEDVVWATADHDDLMRSLNDMYESYRLVVEKRNDAREVLDRGRFSALVRKLKDASYGSVLTSVESRKGWYSYREKMLRGFVRMQAHVNGVELTGDRPTPRQTQHVGNARKGYKGAALPRGVRQRSKIGSWDD